MGESVSRGVGRSPLTARAELLTSSLESSPAILPARHGHHPLPPYRNSPPYPGAWIPLTSQSPEAPPQNSAFLCRASLVSHAWRAAAQERLWNQVVLWHENDTKAFLASGTEGDRTTVALTIRGTMLGDGLVRVVRAGNGLSRVVIVDLTCWDALCLSEMAGKTRVAATVDDPLISCLRRSHVVDPLLPQRQQASSHDLTLSPHAPQPRA